MACCGNVTVTCLFKSFSAVMSMTARALVEQSSFRSEVSGAAGSAWKGACARITEAHFVTFSDVTNCCSVSMFGRATPPPCCEASGTVAWTDAVEA